MSEIRISRPALNEVEHGLDKYREWLLLLEQTGVIMENTQKTYLLHSENFVRWLEGKFEPGGRNKP